MAVLNCSQLGLLHISKRLMKGTFAVKRGCYEYLFLEMTVFGSKHIFSLNPSYMYLTYLYNIISIPGVP